MDQEIRFCDVDGSRIAVATVGTGPPLVLPAWWISHLEVDWRRGSLRSFVEELAREHTVIRYDRLGTGLSDRERGSDSISLEHEVRTFEAILAELGIERTSLFGVSCGGCIATAFASRHPERVERLVLYGAYADGRLLGPDEVLDSMLTVVRAHWGLGSRLLAEVFMPDSGPPERREFADFQRASASAEMAAMLLQLVYDASVRDLLPTITAPTLVLHRRRDRAVRFPCGREVAALVPGARFVPLEGSEHMPWSGRARQVTAAALAFLRGEDALPELSGDGADTLSDREREVLRLVADGMSDIQIAQALVLSPHTVHRHVANIRTKLGQPTRASALAEAARLQLI